MAVAIVSGDALAINHTRLCLGTEATHHPILATAAVQNSSPIVLPVCTPSRRRLFTCQTKEKIRRGGRAKRQQLRRKLQRGHWSYFSVVAYFDLLLWWFFLLGQQRTRWQSTNQFGVTSFHFGSYIFTIVTCWLLSTLYLKEMSLIIMNNFNHVVFLSCWTNN